MNSPSRIHITVPPPDQKTNVSQPFRRPSSLGVILPKSKREISKNSTQISKHRVDAMEKMENEAIEYLQTTNPGLKQPEEECPAPLRKNYGDLMMGLKSLREMNIELEKSGSTPTRGQPTPLVLHADLSNLVKSKTKSRLLDPLMGNLPLCKDNLDQLSKLKHMSDVEPGKSIFNTLGAADKLMVPALVQGTGLNDSKRSQKPDGPVDNHQFRSARHMRTNSNHSTPAPCPAGKSSFLEFL